MKTFDVYAYGVIAASELHLLSTPFRPMPTQRSPRPTS